MKIAGIIAEYDPFHFGHAYHIAATRAAGATHVLVVLGGHFTQRGEAALVPKDVRVRMALAGGADLVVELPQPWAAAAAEDFALGGAALLNGAGCVDMLSFGSESGDLPALTRAAACLESDAYAPALRAALKSGAPFPAAAERALRTLCGAETAAVLRYPNDTLGVEYCRALRRLHSPIVPCAIRRSGAMHNSADISDGTASAPASAPASAGAIRAAVRAGQPFAALLPAEPARLLTGALEAGHCLTDTALADRIMLSGLRMLSKSALAALPGNAEGLENRLYAALRQAPSLKAALEAVKTRRYTAARLRRMLTAAYLQLPADIGHPPYIRVLGLSARGAEILHRMKDTACLPLFTDPMQPPSGAEADRIFAAECRAYDLYGALLPVPLPCGQAFTTGMLRYPAER